MENLFGVYNTQTRKFCFGITEPSKTKARKKLFDRIGTDAYKWRFEIRKIKNKNGGNELAKRNNSIWFK